MTTRHLESRCIRSLRPRQVGRGYGRNQESGHFQFHGLTRQPEPGHLVKDNSLVQFEYMASVPFQPVP